MSWACSFSEKNQSISCSFTQMQCSLFTPSVAHSLPWWHSFSTTAHLQQSSLSAPVSRRGFSHPWTLWPGQIHLLLAALAGSLWHSWFWDSSSCRGVSSTACQHLSWRFHWCTNKVEGVFLCCSSPDTKHVYLAVGSSWVVVEESFRLAPPAWPAVQSTMPHLHCHATPLLVSLWIIHAP